MILELVRHPPPGNSLGVWDQVQPLVTTELIKESEKRLGFEINVQLVELYRTVGNGGFGPGYGLLGLWGGYDSGDGTAVSEYLQRREQFRYYKNWFWPEGLLPICDLGCRQFICVDCVNNPEI